MLDVGCGVHPHPRADVVLDLYVGLHSPDIHTRIDPALLPNPIRGDAQNLPIRDDVFEKAYSRALLEHLPSPGRALREMLRVAREEVEIIVPHRLFRNSWLSGPPREHRWFFGVSQVQGWLEQLGLRYSLRVERRGFPSDLFALLHLPHLIHIKIYPLEEGFQWKC